VTVYKEDTINPTNQTVADSSATLHLHSRFDNTFRPSMRKDESQRIDIENSMYTEKSFVINT
jgi:hypothetical protein